MSEAIARSDRGPLPKIKEMMQSMKGDQGTEEVSHAFDQMNMEIVSSFPKSKARHLAELKPKETEQHPELRRENHIVKGTASFFSGIALMIFLYYFSAALVLKIPPETLARIPFEVEPVARMLWLIGLIPTLSGLGRIIAGLLVRPAPEAKALREAEHAAQPVTSGPEAQSLPGSVTERTTELLEEKAQLRGGK
ncbi:MAG TPA: hypothetical protein VJT09_00195 [Pyrinomonadaceae bacterium]|nr:hypothetical protein [Pyrinomonadaceae bacterium]